MVDDLKLAADLFLNLILGRNSKRAVYGIEVDPEAQEWHQRATIGLFLAGVRPYSA